MLFSEKNDGETSTTKASKVRKTKAVGKKKSSTKRPRDASDSDTDESKRSKPSTEPVNTEQSAEGSDDSESSVYSGEF